jgi:DNA-binding SARP family transcriptional activator/transcriptional regulator with XRE-family HTH domain
MAEPALPGAISALVRRWRVARGLTQQQLAERSGVSIGSLRDLEQGRRERPRSRSLDRLADALGLDPRQREQLAQAAGAGRSRPARAPRSAAAPANTRARLADTGGSVGPAGLYFGVLGPLVVYRRGVPVNVGTPAARALLGLLTLHPGVALSRELLISALWGDDPPSTAVATVQSYVSRLRSAIDAGRRTHARSGLLSSEGTSYRLNIAEDQLDLFAYRGHVARARAAAAARRLGAANREFAAAVEIWRGEPLADIDRLREHPAVVALSIQRAAVIVEYAEVAAASGRYERLIPALIDLVSHDPLNERAHAALMIALAGSGQQAAALKVYEDIVRRLDDQLGVRPGAQLNEALTQVLRQDFEPAGSSQANLVAGRVVPRQLPAAAAGFVGRERELSRLSGLLTDLPGTAGTVVAIGGTAGVGKTTLAVHWANQIASQFPDGQLYLDLRAADPSGGQVASTTAVRRLLTAFRLPAESIPADLEDQSALYRSQLARRRVLVVLDNAHDVAQVRPLLPGGPGCLAVVISRTTLIGLIVAQGAFSITLEPFDDAGARALLDARLGARRTADEPEAVAELIEWSAGLPLALAVISARAATRTSYSLAAIVLELKNSPDRLDVLATGDAVTDLRESLSWSYRHLSETSARMFRSLGLHADPEVSAEAAARLAGLPLAAARACLRELSNANLLAEPVPGRYTFPDLLRAYAAEQARASDS